MANSSTWISHVEAFVDVSRPSSEQAASVDAIAALVKKDVLSIEALVRELELYLTTTDNVIRARGILLLAEILTHLILKPLDSKTISSLAGFFTSRLADWQALRGALFGCLALLRRKNNVGMVTGSDARMLVESYLKNVQAQSLAVHDRKLCFEVLQCLLDIYPDAIAMLGDDLVYGICDAIDGEKDPRCLMLTFHLVETLVQLFPDSSDSVATFAGDLFEILGCYFPIYYTHPRNDDFEIKRDDLSEALMHAFCSTPFFEPFAIPLLLEKLSSSLPLAKLDSLKYLNNCIQNYGADRMIKHAKPIWHALKDVICTFSPEGSLSSSTMELTGDMESQDTEILKEALLCLQRAISLLNSANNDLFLSLLVEDEDIEMIFQSVTGERSDLDLSKENQRQLCALGSVLSNSMKVSSNCCDKIFHRYFPRLMDILGVVKRNSSNGYVKNYKTSSGTLNFGALYLCVELLASCRDLVVAARELPPQLMLAGDNWCCLLQDYSTPITYILGSALEMTHSSAVINGNSGRDHIYYRVNGLQVLSTFPRHYSPISDDVYEGILMLLMSVVTDRSEDTHVWRLSLKALIKIGSFMEESQDSEKKISYNRIVVERIVALLPPDTSTLPLSLKLEAISEIGITGMGFMSTVIRGLEEAIVANFLEALVEGNVKSAESLVPLVKCYSSKVLQWCQTSAKFDEVAVHFLDTIWNQMETVTAVKTDYRNQCLDAIMMTLKIAVGGCTDESQNLIVQKAYNVFSSSFSFLPSKIEGLHFAVDLASLSSKDEWLLYLFAAVLIGLRPQTVIPDVRMLLNLFMVFLIKGHLPAAQALASMINKWPAEIHKTEVSNGCTLEEAIEVIFKMGFSNVHCSSHLRDCTFTNEDNSLTSSDNSSYEICALVGLAWIGKGLLMRGHERVKDIVMLFLKCILSSQDMTIRSLHQDGSQSASEQDKYYFVARYAADAFHILLSDSEDCLNKKFHATIKPLHKQRFFSSMMPVLLSSIKESDLSTTRAMLYRAFGHVISDTPMAAIVAEAKKVIPSLLDSLSALSSDILNKDLIYNLLLVLSGVLMNENGKEVIMENVHTIIDHLVNLTSYPHMMVVRETAIQCLVAMSGLPHTRIYPMRPKVLQAVSKALDDRKRAVRQEAVRCRQAWASIASRSLHF